MRPFHKQTGFTLIELIIVIVILGLLGVLGANFISKSFESFRASESRAQIYEEGKIALVRMELEIHNAVPNAFNPAAAADLRFAVIDEMTMAAATNIFGVYQEDPPTSTLTDVSGGFLPVNSIISIYNRNWTDLTTGGGNQRLYAIVAPAGSPMTLSKNVTPPRSSPQKRYYAVDRTVRYFLNGNILMRSQSPINSGNLNTIENNLVGATPYPLCNNVVNLQFNYTPGTAIRNAVVSIAFTLARDGETINFHKEVMVRNVP